MPSPSPEHTDTTMHGPRTRHYGVRVTADDRRDWMEKFPVCPALAAHQMMHLGRAKAYPPYRVVRAAQLNSYFFACLAGEGRVLVDGRHHPVRAGSAFLLPPHILNEFFATGTKGWEFCWVCYHQPRQQRPLASSGTPVLAKFDAESLRCAIEGLLHEAGTTNAPAEIHHWVELIHGYVLRFAQPEQLDHAIWRLWEKVGISLGDAWTLDRMAAEVHGSAEHLRRLCHRQLGRSPVQQLIYLRMRRAAHLLITTDAKIETIANDVGYENPFVISTTFKRAVGWRPSEYRLRATRG